MSQKLRNCRVVKSRIHARGDPREDLPHGVFVAQEAPFHQARNQRGGHGLGVRAQVPAVLQRHRPGLSQRPDTDGSLRFGLAVDLYQRGDCRQSGARARLRERGFDEGLQLGVGVCAGAGQQQGGGNPGAVIHGPRYYASRVPCLQWKTCCINTATC
jgi:hypothetical protein